MNVFKGLLRSRKVWLAIVGVVQTIIFTLLPDFDPAVWQAINVLLLAVIAGIAVEDAASNLHEGKPKKPDVHILPAALEGDISSMKEKLAPMEGDISGPPPSARAWTPPE